MLEISLMTQPPLKIMTEGFSEDTTKRVYSLGCLKRWEIVWAPEFNALGMIT
jgi:hypothetical protein